MAGEGMKLYCSQMVIVSSELSFLTQGRLVIIWVFSLRMRGDLSGLRDGRVGDAQTDVDGQGQQLGVGRVGVEGETGEKQPLEEVEAGRRVELLEDGRRPEDKPEEQRRPLLSFSSRSLDPRSLLGLFQD